MRLTPGTILRAREIEDEDDPFNVIKITGLTGRVNDVEEATFTSATEFTATHAAPVNGEGGLLRAYEVLSEGEVASLWETPISELVR